jgi:hypothetical protein
MLSYLTIEKFAIESGYTAGAIRAKIKEGVWSEGYQYIRAPDSRVLVSVEGFEKWAEKQNTKMSGALPKVASKSRSTIRRKQRNTGAGTDLPQSPVMPTF